MFGCELVCVLLLCEIYSWWPLKLVNDPELLLLSIKAQLCTCSECTTFQPGLHQLLCTKYTWNKAIP